MNGWVASLLVGGVTCIVAGNLEQAPITGRRQLKFNLLERIGLKPRRAWLTAASVSDGMPTAFKASERPLHRLAPSALKQQGEQLMEASYQKIASAVADLAVHDVAIQEHLSSFPGR